MKYLLLLLIPLTLFSAERKEIRKAKKEIAEVNILRSKATAFCGLLTSATDKATCNDALNVIVKGRLQGMVGNVTTDYFDKAHKELEIEIVEEECVLTEQSKLIERGQTFIGTETCTQLEYALCVYDYTKLLTDAGQTPVATTCAGLRNEWAVYQEAQQGSGE